MISVRVEIEPIREQDMYGVINKIHSVFARRIMDEVKKATPVDTGELMEHWGIHREDVHTTHVYNDADHAAYLYLGTGVWGARGDYWQGQPKSRWRAHPHGINKSGLTRGINPRKIATRVNAEMLRELNQLVQIRQASIADDSYKVSYYDWAEDLDKAIVEGVEKAVEEMNE